MAPQVKLHQLTINNIESQGTQMSTTVMTLFNCGCEQSSGKWFLCGYHEGYDDGAEAADFAHQEAQP